MELTAEQISSNWDTFLGYIETYISSPRKEKLLEFYKGNEERFALMPASHKPQYHSCFPGGYIYHVNNVVRAALKLKDLWVEEGTVQNFTDEELVFSAINHDLGKFGTMEEAAYLPQTDAWRAEKLGEKYMYNDKLEFMPVPDRSLFLLMLNGINFSRNEMIAIKIHDGMYDEANKAYLVTFQPETKPRTSLVYILHHADMMASRIEFEQEWFPKFGKPKEVKKVVTSKQDNINKNLKNVAAGSKLNKTMQNMLDKI